MPEMSCDSTALMVAPALRSAEIVQFPRMSRHRSFRTRDRIETLRWAVVAEGSGLSKVDICDNEPDPEIDPFILVYEDGREWASWGVSHEDAGFCVWRTGASGEIGTFLTMREALDAILMQPRRRRRKLPIS